MIRAAKRLSLSAQFSILLAVVMSLASVGAYVTVTDIRIANAREAAGTYADIAELLTVGGVHQDGPVLNAVKAAGAISIQVVTEPFGQSAGPFERRALERLRLAQASEPSAANTSGEYVETTASRLLYARPLYAGRALIGVLTVSVPLRRDLASFLGGFSSLSWFVVALFVLAVAGILVFVRVGVIRPIDLLTQYADTLKRADIDDELPRLVFDDEEKSSANQVHLLSASLKALYVAMQFYRRARH